MSVRLF